MNESPHRTGPRPDDEEQRLAALRALRILDTPTEERFDRITRLAQQVFDVPIALISLVDANRQWFKSCLGLPVEETERGISFCAHAILESEPLVIEDARLDPRFADNPLVVEEPYIRFYAGAPLSVGEGYRIGTLCIIDHKPRTLSRQQVCLLQELALLAENELRHQERAVRFQALIENSSDLIMVVGAEGSLLYESPSYARVLGYRGEDRRGRSAFELLHPDDSPKIQALHGELLGRPGDTVPTNARLRHRDGSWRYFEGTAQNLVEEPSVAGMVINLRDVTERRDAEVALAELSRYQQSILNSAGEGILGVDQQGRATLVNPAAAHMLGYEAGELIGHPLHALVHHTKVDGRPYPLSECPMHASLVDGTAHRGDHEAYWSKDGAPIPVEYVSTPILENDSIVGAVVTFRDISDRLRAEETLQRVEQLKRFLSPQLAELIASSGRESLLQSHRRDIAVVFCDLRGFTAFSETAEPEDVIRTLAEYHQALGEQIRQEGGTVGFFAGDGIMVFFNDPLEIPDPSARAVRMAMGMRDAVVDLAKGWHARGFDLGFGMGIARGYATLGTIGFEGRQDYTAIGSVVNQAARLCAEARAGQILISQRVYAEVQDWVEAEHVADFALKGLHRPVPGFNVVSTVKPLPEKTE